MYLKKHYAEQKLIIAVCDKELIGQSFHEGKLQLEIHPDFYKGDIATEKKIAHALQEADIANITGKRAIECAIKYECINKKNIILINGMPHAQMIRI